MKTLQAIIISVAIVTAAVIVRGELLTNVTENHQKNPGRYLAIQTDAVIRINVIDTYTGAVRHCQTEDYQLETARCSAWIGGEQSNF
jgi:hypothetical protein